MWAPTAGSTRGRCGGPAIGGIVSFEPVRHDFEELSRRAARDPKWTVHQLALGRAEGSIDINVAPSGLSSALPPSEYGGRRYQKLTNAMTETVPVVRLDEILDDVLAHVPDPRPYLKLDTRGFDLEVFAGLGERAKDFVGMQSEVALLRIYQGMPRMPESLRGLRGRRLRGGRDVPGHPGAGHRASAGVRLPDGSRRRPAEQRALTSLRSEDPAGRLR